jgi:hypothetical protein
MRDAGGGDTFAATFATLSAWLSAWAGTESRPY